MLFFADSGEGVVVQATMMGGVAILVTSLLLLLSFLDNPYHGGVGSLKPVAMEGTLKLAEAGDEHRRASRGPVRRGGLAAQLRTPRDESRSVWLLAHPLVAASISLRGRTDARRSWRPRLVIRFGRCAGSGGARSVVIP